MVEKPLTVGPAKHLPYMTQGNIEGQFACESVQGACDQKDQKITLFCVATLADHSFTLKCGDRVS